MAESALNGMLSRFLLLLYPCTKVGMDENVKVDVTDLVLETSWLIILKYLQRSGKTCC